MFLTLDNKPVHSICVDKTDCQHEVTLDKDGNMRATEHTGSPPTEKLTKDSIRKEYEESQKKAGK